MTPKEQNKQRLPIFSFWLEGSLADLHLACIQSWLNQGHEVSLFSYGEIVNAPEGVQCKDAHEILSMDQMHLLRPLRKTKHADVQAIVSQSDLFRMKAMQHGLGIWLDTDMYLFQPIEIDPTQPHLAWEGEGPIDKAKVGVSALYFPAHHPALLDFLSVLDDLSLMPKWMGFRRRFLKTLHWRIRGLPFRATDIAITAYGNLAIRELVKKHGLQKHILPKSTYYEWIGHETHGFFDRTDGRAVLEAADAIGIHVHRKIKSEQAPIAGSLYAEALESLADSHLKRNAPSLLC